MTILKDGSLCGQPAVISDPRRGILVCEEHRPAASNDEAGLQIRFWSHIVPVVARAVREREGAHKAGALTTQTANTAQREDQMADDFNEWRRGMLERAVKAASGMIGVDASIVRRDLERHEAVVNELIQAYEPLRSIGECIQRVAWRYATAARPFSGIVPTDKNEARQWATELHERVFTWERCAPVDHPAANLEVWIEEAVRLWTA